MKKPLSASHILAGVAVVAILAGIGVSLVTTTSKTNGKRSLNAVLTGAIELPLAPENISTIPLYQIHANLWGTLLRSGGKEGLARLVHRSSDGKILTLELMPQAKFSNGRPIEAADVIYSFQRLVGRQNKGHFNAKGVIRDMRALAPNRVEIELFQPTPALPFLLSIPEMGIVPREACDANGDIVDLKVTSGAYRIEVTATTAKVELVKNETYAFHQEGSPAAVTVVFRLGKEPIRKAFIHEASDFIEVYDGAGIEAAESLKELSEVELFSTKPSYSSFAVNTSSRMNPSEKKALSRLISEKLAYAFKPDIEHKSFEILPPRTFGTLNLSRSPIEMSDYKSKLPRQVSLRVLGKTRSSLVSGLIRTMEEEGIQVEAVENGQDAVDLELRGQGMNSDFPEIEFFLNMASPYAFIPATESERALIEGMLHTTDLSERSASIQRVGRGILEDGRVIPLAVRSYVHLYRKGTVLNSAEVTDYDGDVLFYRMRLAP